MKLHRTLATAVVTAVMGPVALLAATAAHATGEEPAATAKPSASASAEPSAAESAVPSGEPSPAYTRPTFCSGIPDEDRGKTGLRGLPGKIVAGSGWHEFTYRVRNVSKVKVMEIDVDLDLGTADPKINDVSELVVTVDWFNPATGKWKPIEGGGAGVFDNHEFATLKNIEPGRYADAKMRIKIGKKAKAGSGYFFTTGHSYGEDGQCGFDEISRFDFHVLAAGSKPGKVTDAKVKPGKAGTHGQAGTPGKPGTAGRKGAAGHTGAAGTAGAAGNKPGALGSETPVDGKLAATGSSDALPTVAAIGGAAVLAGAGAVFVVRRRREGSGA
ncbi:LAETG motif-containing sortase-dependent surface protein [Streptomyces sp. NPDC101227]|uniref:LAETG motif-containing sortase-dependent surface protein n=1 Tax=Streptomyces sp. NPDC101227 TaxID=3366136 RepID=UPI00382FEBAA